MRSMITMSRTLVALLLASVGGLANASAPLSIYTVNYPLQYFAQRIAGEHARVPCRLTADGVPVW